MKAKLISSPSLVLFLGILFSLFVLQGKAQNKKVLDSLLLHYETTDVNNLSLETFDSIVGELSKGNADKTILFLRNHIDDLDEAKSNKIALIYSYRYLSNAFMAKGQKDSSLKYINLAISHNEILDNEEQRMLNNNTLADFLSYELEYDKAMGLLYKSLDYFEKNGQKEECAETLFSIALISKEIGSIKKSLEVLNDALDIFEELEQEERICEIYYQLGDINMMEEDMDGAKLFYEKSEELSSKLSYSVMLSAAYYALASIAAESGDFKEEKKYIFKAITLDEELESMYGLAYDHLMLASYYIRLDSLDEAKEKLMLCYEYSLGASHYQLLTSSLNQLADIEYKQSNYKAAADYQIALNELLDTAYMSFDYENLVEIEQQYELDKQEQIYTLESQKKKYQNLVLLLIVSILCIVAILLWVLQRSRSKRVAAEKEKLEEKLMYKNKELATNILYLVNKNELIASISKKLVKLKLNSVKKENQVILSELVSEIQHNLDDEVWKEFEIRFQEVHADFYKHLNERFPKLSVNERRLAAFLRLNMSTKEIMAVTHQSQSAIEMARSRLRKKINLSADENLSAFFAQF